MEKENRRVSWCDRHAIGEWVGQDRIRTPVMDDLDRDLVPALTAVAFDVAGDMALMNYGLEMRI